MQSQSPMMKIWHVRIRRILRCLALFLLAGVSLAQAQQSPSELNGGSVLAMAGKDCVALAVDKRFGSGNQMVNVNPRHVLTPNPRMMVAFTGFESDVQSLSQVLSVEVQSKLGRAIGLSVGASSQKSSIISPKAMASLTSHVLYKRRNAPYYVEPLIVGLQEVGGKEKKFRPYLCQMDCIGAKSSSKEFVCGGLASNSLYGTSEALWEPDLEPDRLLKVCAQAFQSALERDCLSGYGTTIYMITKDGIEEYDLANRND